MQPVLLFVSRSQDSPIEGPLEYRGTSEVVWAPGGVVLVRFPIWRLSEWLESLDAKCDNGAAKAGPRFTPTLLSGMGQCAQSDSAEDKNFPRTSGASS